ncbi:hypothetical protein CC1G_03444 [Coprinopsis cinerea okayama7|uniref:Uncharacterized protein n=1 Tax=Coprinopsis cinerea (strain Okayama-7 / 130 / ATCC MYA-4618 / FGSC 9003) TaxID=240176 RepID=A8NQR6_COPC7|nr:hypothetical protein CC1G_03444 [Coprinopsis cinerea okayama7\|eukprot:XP_001835662.1 hypothetical protein CC1G_03444 [Coprinopsis cinerea okayama7\
MAGLIRLAASSSGRRLSTRGFSSTTIVRSEVPPAINTETVVQKKPIGGFRGGIVGFLFGFSLASSLAAYHLLEEYQRASAALQASVEELKISTEKVSSHVRRIEAVEKDLKALSSASASKEDISKVRAEVKKLYDGLHIEFLDLRSHVWGIQQDLQKLSKKESTEYRI